MKFKNSKIFWGSIPQSPLYSCFCIPYCKWLEAEWGLGTRLLANIVCPRCALTSAVFWLRHCSKAQHKLSLKLGPAHIILALLTSVCTVAGLCIRRFFTVWKTSTTPSACILSIMTCKATNTPLRPIPLLKGRKKKANKLNTDVDVLCGNSCTC